jgi:uncharacterized protein YrrD
MTEHEVNVGARVHSRDGEDIGEIAQVLYHPETGEIGGLLLGAGWFRTTRVVDAGLIVRTNAAGVELSIGADDVGSLPVYIDGRGTHAHPDRSFPSELGSLVDLAGGGGPWMVRGVNGTPGPSSVSIFLHESHGGTETVGNPSLPDDAILIGERTDVVGLDGKKIGHVDELFIDDERCITGLLVRGGWLFKHDVTVPASVIGSVSHDRICLTVSADEAEQADWGPGEG